MSANTVIATEPYQPPIVTRVYMYRADATQPLSGAIDFEGKLGSVKLSLSDESCRKILELLAVAASESIAEVADALRTQFAGVSP